MTSLTAVSLIMALLSEAKDITNYPNCIVSNPNYIGDGVCHNFASYNTKECGFDGEDCIDFNSRYPDCTADFASFVGDGKCDGGDYNTKECGFDAGDCILQNLYPKCTGTYDFLNNSICEREYNIKECGYDGGDCLSFNKKYPNCTVDDPDKVSDGICNGGMYETKECGFDGGDCRIHSNNYWWKVLIFTLVGTMILIVILLCVKRYCDIWASSYEEEEVIVVDATTQKDSNIARKPSEKKRIPNTAEEIKLWRKENFQFDSSSSSSTDNRESKVRDIRTKRSNQKIMHEI